MDTSRSVCFLQRHLHQRFSMTMFFFFFFIFLHRFPRLNSLSSNATKWSNMVWYVTVTETLCVRKKVFQKAALQLWSKYFVSVKYKVQLLNYTLVRTITNKSQGVCYFSTHFLPHLFLFIYCIICQKWQDSCKLCHIDSLPVIIVIRNAKP